MLGAELKTCGFGDNEDQDTKLQTHFSSVAKRWQENDPQFSVPSVDTWLKVEQTSSDNVK